MGLRTAALLGLVLLALLASAAQAGAQGPRAVGARAADWGEHTYHALAARAAEAVGRALAPAGSTPAGLQAQAAQAWGTAWFHAYDAADLALVVLDKTREAAGEGQRGLEACLQGPDPAACLDAWLEWALSA